MLSFRYKAKDSRGRTYKGIIAARSRKEVLANLWSRELIVLEVKNKGSGQAHSFLNLRYFEKKVNSRDMMFFCRLLAALLSAGVPIIKSLRILKENTESQALKMGLEEVIWEVEQGGTLYEAFEKKSAVFPPLFVHMMKAADEGGVLPEVIKRLAEHFEKDYDLKEKVKSAAAYPLVISTVSVFVIIFLIVKVLPSFKNTFKSLGVEMPFLTRVFIGFGELMGTYGKMVIPSLFFLVYLTVRYMRTENGREILDRVKVQVPVFGAVYRKMLAGRFASSMEILLSSGTTLLTSLELTAFMIGSRVFSNTLSLAVESVRRGQSMMIPLEESGLFSLPVVELIRVGEETGTLLEMLEKAAHFLESEVKYVVERLNTLIEPALIVILAFVVGIISLSILLPMFTVFQQIL